jgi:hypothetical protein
MLHSNISMTNLYREQQQKPRRSSHTAQNAALKQKIIPFFQDFL